MLLIIITSIWLIVLIGCVSLCVTAARGDAAQAAAHDDPVPLPKTEPTPADATPHLRLISGQGRPPRRSLTSRVAR